MVAEEYDLPDREGEALDWDLEERDRWMDEHDSGDLPDPAITTVEADE